MPEAFLSSHAKVRCQQRGIKPEILDVILNFGRRRSRQGAEVCFMDKVDREHARAVLGGRAYARIADRLNAYLVVASDGCVVTAGKRLARLKF